MYYQCMLLQNGCCVFELHSLPAAYCWLWFHEVTNYWPAVVAD